VSPSKQELRTPVIHLGVYLRFDRMTDETQKRRDETWGNSWEVEIEIPKLREAIEAEFRPLLDASRTAGS
jgi:hypothetical protein